MLRASSPRSGSLILKDPVSSSPAGRKYWGSRFATFATLCLVVTFLMYTTSQVLSYKLEKNNVQSGYPANVAKVYSKMDFLEPVSDLVTHWLAGEKKQFITSFAEYSRADVCEDTIEKGEIFVVLLSSSPSTLAYSASLIRYLAQSFGGKVNYVWPDISTLSSELLPLQLAAEVLGQTDGSLDYSIRQINTNTANVISTGLKKLKTHIVQEKQKSMPKAVGLISFPTAIYFLPFMREIFASGSDKIRFVLVTQNVFDSAFEDIKKTARYIGPYLASEELIDTLCLGRFRTLRKSSNILHVSHVALSPNIRGLLAYEPDEFLEKFDEKPIPCTVSDIPILRQAQIWTSVNFQVLQILRRFVGKTFLLRIEDLLSQDKSPIFSMLRQLFNNCNLRVENITRSKLYENSGEILSPSTLASWRDDNRSHSVLLRQINDIVGAELLADLNYESLDTSLLERYIRPKLSPIDSGTCWKYDNGPLKEYQKNVLTFQYGYCLPTFIVLGVQKASTDELAVWLNFNPYLRRLDGGVEIHYFDCLGRGLGKKRASCRRFRDDGMHWDSHSPEAKKTKETFSWAAIGKKSPYIDDIWKRYSKLGNLNWKDYTQRKTIIFEKTPAYFDLANVMDMYRLLPSLKLLLVLRDPVERLYSGYWQPCTGKLAVRKNCSLSEFARMTKSLISGKVDNSLDEEFIRGIEHGKYVEHINRWRRAYADDRIMVVFASHFKENPQAVIYFIECFLGFGGEKHHIYYPHESNGYKVLGHYSKADHPTHKVPLPEGLRNGLNEFYKPWNIRLFDLLTHSAIVSKPEKDELKYDWQFAYPKWLLN